MKEWEGQKRANQMANLRLGGMEAYLRQKHLNCKLCPYNCKFNNDNNNNNNGNLYPA